MKEIYIVLTHTGTILSRIIKFYTKNEFTHSSISLDVNLEKMYSFGRLNPYNPFKGGFVHEGISWGTFKRFSNTYTQIYSLTITDLEFNTINSLIIHFENNKSAYSFNTKGLFLAGFDKYITSNNTFYCAEFVKYLLDSANLNVNLPATVKPEDFKAIYNLKPIYSGKLMDYFHASNNAYSSISQNKFINLYMNIYNSFFNI